MAERNDSLIELLQNRLQYLLVDKGEGTIPPVRVLAEDLAYIIQTTHQPDESTGFRIVKKGRWLTFCLDDSFINCQCIEEPFISQIVDAFNANATKREISPQWRTIETAPKDGTEILWRGAEGGYCVIHFDTYKECFEEVGSRWMPLPAPPLTKTTSIEGGNT